MIIHDWESDKKHPGYLSMAENVMKIVIIVMKKSKSRMKRGERAHDGRPGISFSVPAMNTSILFNSVQIFNSSCLCF